MKKIPIMLSAIMISLMMSCSSGYVSSRPADQRYSRPLAPGQGYVWTSGDWHYSGHQYQWQEGSWQKERQGRSWQSGHWENNSKGYKWHKGGWQ